MRWRPTVLHLLPIILLSVACGISRGQFVDTVPDKIVRELTSTDKAEVDKAVKEINHAFDEDAYQAATTLQKKWMTALYKANRNDDIVELSKKVVIGQPNLNWAAEYYQINVVRALLKAGKPKEALPELKSLYNVALLKSMPTVLNLAVDCLTQAYPEQPELVEKFKKEQADGATDSGGSCSVLANIKVDPKPYEDRLATLTADEDRHGVGRNNLLLLADRAKDARTGFEGSLAKAKDRKAKLYATGDVAKAIKAEDGTVGRANAWLRANQP